MLLQQPINKVCKRYYHVTQWQCIKEVIALEKHVNHRTPSQQCRGETSNGDCVSVHLRVVSIVEGCVISE